MFVISLTAKNAQDFRLIAFYIGFLAFFCQTQALQCLDRYKYYLFTRSRWPVDLTRHSKWQFLSLKKCHFASSALVLFIYILWLSWFLNAKAKQFFYTSVTKIVTWKNRNLNLALTDLQSKPYNCFLYETFFRWNSACICAKTV